MCATCGCSETGLTTITNLQTGRHIHLPDDGSGAGHEHSHDSVHHEHPPARAGRILQLEEDVLASNRRLAERNRAWFAERAVTVINLMSSPGAGKTTLLERTARDFRAVGELFVIEGDQATLRDAERVREAGARVAQVNTGAGCHLDANMVLAAARQLELPRGATLIIENVGNLVCPALFDLGERARVVVASATEGDEKPVKYPHMFRSADVVMINKVDLLPYVHFDTAAFVRQVLQLNPDATILEISAAHGSGLENWYQWLKQTKTIGI